MKNQSEVEKNLVRGKRKSQENDSENNSVEIIEESLHGDVVKCPTCKKVLVCLKGFGATGLRLHMKTVHNTGFKCEKCQKIFSSKTFLETHMKNEHPVSEKQIIVHLPQREQTKV